MADQENKYSVAHLTEEECRALQGRLFNVQPYSIHDGPGIRTTVFLSGCPLRCRWCQNPESLTATSKLFFYRERCVGCGSCVAVCPRQAIVLESGKAKTDRQLCDACGLCNDVCAAGARGVEGESKTVGEVVDQVLSDALFLKPQQGGVTISGGEALAQPKFSAAIMRLVKEAGLTSCIETSGCSSIEALNAVLEYTDFVLFDIKHMDVQAHEWGTGVKNDIILENLKYIYHDAKKPIFVRIPLIPGYNDSDENIKATCEFIVSELGSDVAINILPYHTLGEAKLERLEIPEELRFTAPKPTDAQLQAVLDIVKSYGLAGQIGG